MTERKNIQVAYLEYIRFYSIYYTISEVFGSKIECDKYTSKISNFIQHILRNEIRVTND